METKARQKWRQQTDRIRQAYAYNRQTDKDNRQTQRKKTNT